MARILIYGDSISWGNFDNISGGWAHMLKNAFLKTGRSNQVYDLSISGKISDSLPERVKFETKYRLHAEYKDVNTIIIALGINDAKLIADKKPAVSIRQFEKNITDSIKVCRKYADNIVIIGLTPVDEGKSRPIPWDEDKYHYNKLTAKYDQKLKQIARRESVHFINILSVWKKLDYKKLLHDGVHPNTKGHKELFKKINSYLISHKLLPNSTR